MPPSRAHFSVRRIEISTILSHHDAFATLHSLLHVVLPAPPPTLIDSARIIINNESVSSSSSSSSSSLQNGRAARKATNHFRCCSGADPGHQRQRQHHHHHQQGVRPVRSQRRPRCGRRRAGLLHPGGRHAADRRGISDPVPAVPRR